MFESPEVFEAYAILDILHCQLEEIIKENSNPLGVPIERAIDAAVGYDAEPMMKIKMKDRIQSAIGVVEQIIHYKGIVGAETDGSKRLADKLRQLLIDVDNKS